MASTVAPVTPDSTGPASMSPRARRGAVLWRRLRSATPVIPGFTPRDEDVIAHVLRRVSPVYLMLTAGLASVLIYFAFASAFPITTLWSHPRLAIEMGKVTDYSPWAAAGYIVAVIALFACQFLMLTAVRTLAHSERTSTQTARLIRWGVLGFPLVFVAIMIWMQPITTTDLYGYVARGYLFAHLHLNPMTMPASQLPGGFSVDRPASPYGPAWLLIAAAVSRLTGEDLLANMLLFKVIAALSVGAAIWLVSHIAGKLYKERQLHIVVLFAWSPLLLFEAVGNGHNDIVMMACVLAAFALMLRGNARWAFAFLVIGALLKYVSVVFVPLWLVYELRQRMRASYHSTMAGAESIQGNAAPASLFARVQRTIWRSVASAWESVQAFDRRQVVSLLASVTVIGATLVAVCYAPFWEGPRTFTGLGQQLRPLYYNGSIVQFIAAPLELLVAPNQYPALDKTVRLVFYFLFGVYAFLQVRKLWLLGQRVTIEDIVSSAANITFASLILITFWFQPWYVVWLLPLAALAKESFIRRQSVMLACGALLTYAVSNYFPVGTSGIGRDLFVQFFEVLVTFTPLLLLRTATVPVDGWGARARQYMRAFSEGITWRPVFWDRVMLLLILVVAALLRLLRLGNIFAALPPTNSQSGALNEISAGLKLFLADPRGLHGPFVAVQGAFVAVFGHTSLAILLPYAIIGTLTVFMVYLLALELTIHGFGKEYRSVALLAALLAATSGWHVSLSRSGMDVVVLPLLLVTGMYWLLRALRCGAIFAASVDGATLAPARLQRQRALFFAGCGVCTGLACDITPGLWLAPLMMGGLLLIWRWRRPEWFGAIRPGLILLVGLSVVAGIPAIWQQVSAVIGFPTGSAFFARSAAGDVGFGPLTAQFWEAVGRRAGQVLGLLFLQDYSAGYPSVGGTPIIPPFLGWIFVIGLLYVLWTWRNVMSLALLLMMALPLLASMALSTPASIIEAACVLPAMCIVPALAIRKLGEFFSHLPIVLDRIHGVRVFGTPEQIGRVLLLVFLVISTIRTFFWYFEATLPSTPPNQWIPT